MIRFLTNPTTWLTSGVAVVALAAAPALAITPQEVARQADEDAKAAASMARDVARDARREARVWRSGDVVYMRDGADRSQRLSDLLQLRADQQPALKTFLEAMEAGRDSHGDHMARLDRDGDKTTLQRLDEMQAKLAEQQAAVGRRIAAIKAFYGQLDAKQQKAFDSLPMLMVVGPSVGPMMIPHAIPIAHRMPLPPEPPEPPQPPES